MQPCLNQFLVHSIYGLSGAADGAEGCMLTDLALRRDDPFDDAQPEGSLEWSVRVIRSRSAGDMDPDRVEIRILTDDLADGLAEGAPACLALQDSLGRFTRGFF